MGGRARHEPPASDAEIFFASVHGATLILLLNQLLVYVLTRSAEGTFGPSLLARAAPLASVRLLFTFFVLLPSFLAFAAIGVPFFLRTLSNALRGRLARGPRRGLLLLAACAVGAAVEVRFGGSGTLATAFASLLGLRLGLRPLASIGRAHGFRLLAASGLMLGAVAWYEWCVLQGREPGIALAPTAIVAAAFFAVVGLVTASADVLRYGQDGLRRLSAAWLVTIAWMSMPVMRAGIAASPAAADRVELATAAIAAAMLVSVAVLRQTR